MQSNSKLSGSLPTSWTNESTFELFSVADLSLLFSQSLPAQMSRAIASLQIGSTRISGTISPEALKSPLLVQFNVAGPLARHDFDTQLISGTIPENITSPLLVCSLAGNRVSGSLPTVVLGSRDFHPFWKSIVQFVVAADEILHYINIRDSWTRTNVATVLSLNSNKLSGKFVSQSAVE